MRKELFPLLIVFLSLGVLAHLDDGQDIKNNGYIIDVGYSPKEVHSNQATEFAFNLVNETNEENINFTSVWIRILDKNVIFSGELSSKNSNSIMTYTFPKSGNYTLDVIYKNGEKTVVQQQIYLNVLSSSQNIFVILSVIIILFLILLIIKKKFHTSK